MANFREPIGPGRKPLRKRFVGSTYVTATGAFSVAAPAGATSCDIYAIGGGGTGGYAYDVNTYRGGPGSLAIRLERPLQQGMVFTGTVGAMGHDTIVDGMVAGAGSPYNYNLGPFTPGVVSGGDVNIANWRGGIRDANIPNLDAPTPPLYPGWYPGVGGVDFDNRGRNRVEGTAGGVVFLWYVEE